MAELGGAPAGAPAGAGGAGGPAAWVAAGVAGAAAAVAAGGPEPHGAGGGGARGVRADAVMWAVLDELHAEHCAVAEEVVRGEGRRTVAVPEREIYYRLKNSAGAAGLGISGPSCVTRAVARAEGVLGCPREELGVISSGGKGIAAGCLRVWSGGTWHDCRAQGRFAVPGDPRVVATLCFQTSARFILVVEKETVFKRLLEEELDTMVPVVLVSGRGYPDVSTRVFMQRLASAFPALPVVGLVDWNPHGVAILSLFKHGFVKNMRSTIGLSAAAAVPQLVWAGIHAEDIPDGAQLQEYTARDRAMANMLLTTSPAAGTSAWAREVRKMATAGAKADIEALHSYGSQGGVDQLAKLVLLKLLRRAWF